MEFLVVILSALFIIVIVVLSKKFFNLAPSENESDDKDDYLEQRIVKDE